MKPDKVLCCRLLFAVLALTIQNEKIVYGPGLSNLNLGIFVCSLMFAGFMTIPLYKL